MLKDHMNTNRHSVWLATEFQIDALTPQEAMERAQDWLTTTLENAFLTGDENVTVVRPASRLTDIASLAFQLLALEGRGGNAAARVAKLRAEVDAEMQAEMEQDDKCEEGFEFPYKY